MPRGSFALLSGTALLFTACSAVTEFPTSIEMTGTFASVEPITLSCSGCHGGRSGAATPSLEGRTRDDILNALTSYKNDPNGTTVMHRIARGYTIEQLADVSDQLADQEAR